MILDGVCRERGVGMAIRRCGRRDLCEGQQFFVVSQLTILWVFLNSASWGAIPSVCFVRCTCALKYEYE